MIISLTIALLYSVRFSEKESQQGIGGDTERERTVKERERHRE